MVEVSSIVSVAEALGILVGIALAIMQLRELNKTRRAELFMDLFETFRDKVFQKQYAEILFHHEWKNSDDW